MASDVTIRSNHVQYSTVQYSTTVLGKDDAHSTNHIPVRIDVIHDISYVLVKRDRGAMLTVLLLLYR